jgi:hypothetical protein
MMRAHWQLSKTNDLQLWNRFGWKMMNMLPTPLRGLG